jgi:RNA polymerase sigma-70 factor, ECF subfamily
LASISAYHCTAANYESTDWQSILFLYNKLIDTDPSPLVLLNRSVALAKVKGTEAGVTELEKLKSEPSLQSYHLFYTVYAEFYMELNRYPESASMLRKAIELTPLETEKSFLEQKLAYCENIFS